MPHCDFQGICKNKAFREVYPTLLKGKLKKKGWRYLCKKHFYEEQRSFTKHGEKLSWAGFGKIERVRNMKCKS